MRKSDQKNHTKKTRRPNVQTFIILHIIRSGKPVVHKQTPLQPSAYQQSLDAGTQAPELNTSNVKYWSDYSRVFYHPRSLVQLYDFELNSTTMPFERFSMGTELFSVLDKEHEMVDRDWRPFAEECDQMQGIQVFTGIDDAWGGYASSYIEALRDEYPKTCIWVWGLQNPMVDIPISKRQLRLSNVAHSIARLSSQATTLVPLALPEDHSLRGVNINPKSPWHVSAIMSSAIETATLPSRLTRDSGKHPGSLADLAENLNAAGNQPLASLKMSLPPTNEADNDTRVDVDFFQIGQGKYRRGGADDNPHIFGQVLSHRGEPSDKSAQSQDKSEHDRRQHHHPLVGNPVVRMYETSLKFPLLDSYPRIYTQLTSELLDVGISTTLATDNSMVQRIKNLRQDATRLAALDEREDLSNDLAELADAYHDGWSSGSDDDDDDA